MKKLLLIVLAIVAAVFVAGFVALYTIDFDGRFKSLASDAVERATGRKLVINGTVKLSLLPLPGLTVEDVAIANAPWSDDPSMVRLGRLSARVYLVPLLLGNGLHIDRMLLKDVTLNLQTDALGRNNWQLAPPASSGGPDTPAQGRFALQSIGDVRLENVTVQYRDDRVGKTLTGSLEQMSLVQALDGSLGLTASVVAGGTPVAMKAALGAPGAQPYPIDISIQALGTHAVLRGNVADPLAAKGLDLAVTLEGDNAAELNAATGVTLPAKPYRLAAKLTGDVGGTIALTALQSNIGTSTITGELNFTIAGARPKFGAKLDAKLLDLAELLPPHAPDHSAASGDNRVFSNDPLPFAALTGIDADLALTIADLRGTTMPLRNLAVKATLNDRELEVASFAVDLPEGHVAGAAGVVARQAPASVKFSLAANRLDLGALLKQLAGIDLLATKGDVAVSLTGRGQSLRAIMATLNGTANLEAGRGVIRSRFADLVSEDVFREGFAWFQGRRDLTLNCVVARFDISGGIATAHGLLLDADLVTISGSGTINLGAERYALELFPKPKPTNLLNLGIPLDVDGRLNHPTVTPNRAALAKTVVLGVAGTVNPLLALVPLVLDGGNDSNGCVAALSGKQPPAQAPGPAGAVGGAVKQLNQTLEKLLP